MGENINLRLPVGITRRPGWIRGGICVPPEVLAETRAKDGLLVVRTKTRIRKVSTVVGPIHIFTRTGE